LLTVTQNALRFSRMSRTMLVIMLAFTAVYDITTHVLSVVGPASLESGDVSGTNSGASDGCVGARPMPGPYRPDGDYGWTVTILPLVQFGTKNNSNSDLQLIVCENGIPLTPAPGSAASIKEVGGGRYLYSGTDLLFSTSDGSDPNANLRRYAIRIAK
jgi:hypothetical protein